jgi:flagellar biosynthesis protein FlhB
MVKRLKVPIRVIKWFAFLLVIASFLSSQVAKLFHIAHLQKVGFDMASISPISLVLGLFSSVVLILLVFVDWIILPKYKLKDPLQWLLLLGGGFGIIYNLVLLYIYYMM